MQFARAQSLLRRIKEKEMMVMVLDYILPFLVYSLILTGTLGMVFMLADCIRRK